MTDETKRPDRVRAVLGRGLRDRRGTVAIEYGILIAMVMIALVGMASLGTSVRSTLYDTLATAIASE